MDNKTLNPNNPKVIKALDDFEWQEYNYTGMKNINGGYTRADIYDYDDDYFYIELNWGEEDMGDGYSVNHTESYKMDRVTLEIE